jgi:hypothetical protein
MVNSEGRRFIDEGEDFHAYTYAKTGAEILKQPGGIAYQIFDEKLKEAVNRYLYDGATPVVANSIKELAEMLEINPDALRKTVEEFNNAVVEDRPFNEVIRDGRATKGIYPPKSNWAQKLDTPPYTLCRDLRVNLYLWWTQDKYRLSSFESIRSPDAGTLRGGRADCGIFLLQLSEWIGTFAWRCHRKNCRH